MELYTYSVDLIRIVFLIGAVLSLAYKKRTGITPGGIVVPGFLAITLDISFLAFICTIGLALVGRGLYHLLFGSFALSTRLAVIANVTIAVILGAVTTKIMASHHIAGQEFLMFSLIAPGLIAHNTRKYGLSDVLKGVLSVTAATYCIGWLLAMALPHDMMSQLTVQLAAYKPLTLANTYVTMGISLLTALAIYFAFKLRAGGYLVMPFMAVVAFSSMTQFLLLIAGVAVSYMTVQLIQRQTLIIGLDRFIVSLFCGYFVVTLIDLAAAYWGVAHYRTSPLILIVAIAVLTNDLCLQPLKASLTKGVGPSMAAAMITRMVA